MDVRHSPDKWKFVRQLKKKKQATKENNNKGGSKTVGIISNFNKIYIHSHVCY